MTLGVTIIGSDCGENLTFQMDKKSITKREMKVRSRIRSEVFQVDLHTGPES